MQYIKRLLLVSLLALMLVGTVSAQNATAEARVDQAMAHLTQFLGLNSPITRQSAFWRWEEIIYADSSFGCPIPNTTYAATPNRAVVVTITQQGVDYNYRLSWDGVIMVLCGSNGVPLYRSDDPNYQPGSNPVPTGTPVPSTNFYTWVYMSMQQRFYLLNSSSGEVAAVNRPMLTNEQADSLRTIGMSRDGRYLLQVVKLTTGNEALLIFNLQTGGQALVPAGTNETISIGNSFSGGSNPSVGARYITDTGNSRVAVGFSRTDDPSVNAWRVALIDLTNGTVVAQVSHAHILSILQGADVAFTSQFTGGSFLADPVLFDNAGGVNFRLIRLFAGGATQYPAIRWLPNEGRAEISPLGVMSADSLPNGSTVYTLFDGNFPSQPSEGPYQPENIIAVADHLQPNPNPRYMATGLTSSVSSPLWAAGGSHVIYSVFGASGTTYRMRSLSAGTEFSLPNAAVGTPGGAISFMDGAESPQVVVYNTQGVPSPIWNTPPMNGNPLFVWVQPSNGALGLTGLFDGQTISAGAGVPSAAVTPIVSGTPNLTCGTLPSRMVVGSRGRSTFDDGSPLNIRTEASTTAAVARIIPEGEQFLVLAGPLCNGGYSWWQIRLDDGLVAWVAEGGRDFYFIEPLN